MQKFAKRLSVAMAALLTVFTALSYVPAKAAVVVPKVQYVTAPQLEYTAGDRVQFNLNAPNYGGRVQYRVVLWDNNNKTMRDLWPTGDRYYTNWMPYGNETFTLGWPISDPGTYRITIYAKRAGVANNKTALKGYNCDSYMESAAFVVKAKDEAKVTIKEIAPIKAEINEGGQYALPTQVDAKMSDDTTNKVNVSWTPAVVDVNKVGEQKFAGKVEGYDKDVELTLTVKAVAFTVADTASNNLKYVDVVFNKDVNKDTVDTTSVKAFAGTVDKTASVELLADGKTVRVYYNQTLAQSTVITLKVNGVKAVKGNELKDYSKNITVMDVTVPTAVAAEALSSRIIDITFNEPINYTSGSAILSTFKVDGNNVIGAVTANKNTLRLNLGNKLSVGAHTVTVKDVADYAGLKIGETTFAVNVVEDKTAPVVTDVVATRKDQITVKFSEPVQNLGTLTIGNNSYTAANVEGGFVPGKSEYAVNLAADFTIGSVLIENTLTYIGQTDLEGNVVTTAQVFKFLVSDDTVKPAASVSVNENNDIIVTFTEGVVNTNLVVTVKNNEGAVVYTVTAPALTENNTVAKIAAATTGFATANPGNYTVEVKGAVDRSVRGNKMDDVVSVITITDKLAPTISSVKLVDAVNGVIRITFSEEMDAATLAVKDNYLVDLTGAGTFALLSTVANNNLTVVDNKTVDIKVPGSTTSTDIKVLGLKDISGKITTDFNIKKDVTALTAFDNAAIKSVNAVALNKVEVTLNTGFKFGVVDPSAFAIKNASDDVLTVIYAEVNADGNKAVLTLNGNLGYDAKVGTDDVYLYTIANTTLDSFAQPLTIADANKIKVVDKIAAQLVAVDPVQITAGVVTIKFTEDLKVVAAGDSALGYIANDLIVKDKDGNVLNPLTDYTVGAIAAGSDTLTINITKAGLTGKVTVTLTNSRYLLDANNNGVSVFAGVDAKVN